MFTKSAYIVMECARHGHRYPPDGFTDACNTSLLNAWNSSSHLRPANGLSRYNHPRSLGDRLRPARGWPADRARKIAEAAIANHHLPDGTLKPAPAPMYSIPAWYTQARAAQIATRPAPQFFPHATSFTVPAAGPLPVPLSLPAPPPAPNSAPAAATSGTTTADDGDDEDDEDEDAMD
jgi:hypothetical protein